MEDQCIRCPQLATVLNIVEEEPPRSGAIKKREGGGGGEVHLQQNKFPPSD